jgi:hypothetical protein
LISKTVDEEIRNLIKKSEQNRQMYFAMSKSASIRNNTLNVFILTGSSIIAILTFADYEIFTTWFPGLTNESYKVIIGIFAGIIFTFTIIENYFGFSKKVATNEAIGKQLTTLIRKMKYVESIGGFTKQYLEEVTSEYSLIHEYAPTIPDKIFLKEKRKLHIKIDISKQIEKEPYLSIPFYILKRKIKYWYKNK